MPVRWSHTATCSHLASQTPDTRWPLTVPTSMTSYLEHAVMFLQLFLQFYCVMTCNAAKTPVNWINVWLLPLVALQWLSCHKLQSGVLVGTLTINKMSNDTFPLSVWKFSPLPKLESIYIKLLQQFPRVRVCRVVDTKVNLVNQNENCQQWCSRVL